MSDSQIIVNQWTCLSEPERALARLMATNLALGTAVVGKEYADAQFEAARGDGWEQYRDFWLANWNIYEDDGLPPPFDFPVYASISAWTLGVALCSSDDCPDDVPCRCLQVTGFPPPC